MKYSTYSFTLDLQVTQAQVSIPVKFGDTARSLNITLTDGGAPFILAKGCWAVFSARKPLVTDNVLFNSCIVDLVNSTIRYDFTEQTSNCEGIIQCEIIIYSPDGKVVGSPRFHILVDKRINYDNIIEPIYEATILDEVGFKATEWENAEATRKVEEETRQSNEETRQTNEETRQTNEETRQTNETTRETNEAARVEAEKTRTTFIPSVSADGILSWTNDKGLENPDSVSLIECVINNIPQAEGGWF